MDTTVNLTEEDIEGAALKGRHPKQLRIQELRFWLSCRGLKSSKLKTKAELIAKVQAVIEDGSYKVVVDPTEDQLHKKRKLAADQGSVVHTDQHDAPKADVVAPSSGWEKCIPPNLDFDDVHINAYSLNSGKKAFKTTSAQPKKKTCIRPETRGYQFFTERYLHDIWCSQCENYVFFKSKCFPSQRKNDQSHNLWCALSKSDSMNVTKAVCTCIAGQSGYCNHVLALLFQISHFAKSSTTHIPGDITKTSLPQAWHKPRIEGILSEPIMQVDVRKNAKHDNNKQFPSTLYEARAANAIANDGNVLQSVQQQLSQENPMYGLNMLNIETNSTVYCRTQLGTYVPRGSPLSYQLALTEGNFHVDVHAYSIDHFQCREGCIVRGIDTYPALPLDNPGEPQVDDNLSTEFLEVLHSLAVDKEKSANIEVMTREQANSSQWWEERKLRLTASKFAEICKRKKGNCSKFIERLQRRPQTNEKMAPSLKHGKDNESVAIRKYYRYMTNTGHKVELQASGLVVRSDLPYLGCSPDSKVLDPIAHPHFGILEVKCPYKYRSVKPREAAEIDKEFCLTTSRLPEESLNLRRDHPYYTQVQGQMALTGARWCDFVVYTFKGLFIERIAYDKLFCDDILQKLTDFYFKSFLPNASL